MRGKKEKKILVEEKKIEYTPQEQEEIDRIVNRLSIETLESDLTTTSIPDETHPQDEYPEEEPLTPVIESDELPELGESPEETIDFDELTDIEPELPDLETSLAEPEPELSDLGTDLTEPEPELSRLETDFTGTEPLEEIKEQPLQEPEQFEEPEITDEIQDITDIIHDIDEQQPVEPSFEQVEQPEEFQEEPEEIQDLPEELLQDESAELQDFEDIEPEDLLAEDFSLPTDIEAEPSIEPESEFDIEAEEPAVEDDLLSTDFPETAPVKEPSLEAAEEMPDEFDLNMLDQEIGEMPSMEEAPEEPATPPMEESLEDIPSPEFEKADETAGEADESEALLDENFLEEYEKAAAETPVEKTAEPEPSFEEMDLSELTGEDFDIQTEEMPSMEEPSIEEGSMPETAETVESDMEEAEDFSALDIEGMELPEEEIQTAEPDVSSDLSEEISPDIQEPEFSVDFDSFDESDNLTEPSTPDIQAIESIDDSSAAHAEEEIDLSDSELKQLRKVIQLFHPNLTRTVKNAIINDQLPSHDLRELVDMLLGGRSEKEVKSFLENKLGEKIDTSADALRRRKVITARPEYTKEGRERQKRLFKITRIFGVAAVIAFLVTIFSYQYIYKPVMAKKYINQGVQLIKRPGVPALQKQKDYREAEIIFNSVNKNYVEDYLYGYHEYAKAYFQNKEFDSSLRKLNEAYEIDSSNVDTLNNLGYFYSKLPGHIFKQIKPDLNKYYYSKVKPVGPVNTQVDVAIDFYRKSLNIDPKNVTALYGIGNAYINQGQNRKARDYFENIVKIDKNSIIGYSGLLNLYIERNALADILTIHSDLRYKEKLSELPSPLLAKLASYYLDKKRTDDTNIRIDYGIQSPVIKDMNDNPYPAVRDVLNALSSKDLNYPPLFIQFARLSEQEGNLNLMKRNLLTALEKEPNYFAANLLLGKYYYLTNEPVEAYRYCKKAIQSYLSPPDFTKENFYHETENIGHAYAIMGNIFYYYFDKMRFRFGDEFEEDNVQEQTEKLANLEIAQDKYEKAVSKNYKSSEIIYNLGRIYYIKGMYEKAITTWYNLYDDFLIEPELMLALGNAFYHQNNLEAGKGEFLKVISIYEDKEEKLLNVIPGRIEHTKIYQTLSTAYNNLGAVYQIQNKETKSNISYWRSIEYAKKIERENEFARVNLSRAFKPGRENVLPVLDESIPESIDAYKETIR